MAETNGAECHRAVGIVRAGGNFLIILIGHNEVELAILQIAAGQNLGGFGGNLDISARRCRVGVYKLCTANGLAVQLINGFACHKLTFAVIGDFESDLVCTGIIPDAAEVALHLADDIGLFAYGFLEFQGKRNVAVCVVEGGIRNRVACLFAQCEREIVRFQCAVADHDIQYLGGVQSYRNFVGVIDVGEFCDVVALGLNYFALWELAIVVALIILSFAFQHAVVVLDIYHNLILGFVVGDARNTAAVLGNEVSVCTCGLEFQLLIAADGGSLIQVVDGSGGTGRQGGIAHTAQGKVEGIRAVPFAAIQLFFDLEQFFGGNLVRVCLVGVYKLGSVVFGIAVFNIRDFQVVGVIQRNRDGGGDIRGLGHAGNIRFSFRNGVGVNTRLFVGDYIEIGDRCAFLCRYGFAALISGHRGTFRCRKGKGEQIGIVPVTAVNALAYAQLGCGFACKGVGEGHLVGVYFCPRTIVVLKVGGRDAQGFIFRTLVRNHSLNQVLLLAVINIILLIRRIFGKQVIIGVTTVAQRVGDIKGNCASRIVVGACHVVCSTVRHGDVGDVSQRVFVFVFRCRFEFEVELTVGQGHRFCFVVLIVVLVDFRGLNIERLGVILKGVGKLNSRSIGGCITIFLNNRGFHFQLTATVVRDGNRHTVEGAVIRNTFNFIDVGGDMLGDVVHIRAGFGEGDFSEVKGNLLSFGDAVLSILHIFRYICTRHIISQRGTIDSHQFEAEFIAVLPIAARQNLYALERVIGVRRFYLNLSGRIGVCHLDFLGCTCRDRACVVRIVRGVACGRSLFRDGIVAACGQAHNLGSLVVFQLESIAALDGFSTLSAGNGVVVAGSGVHVIARQRKLHRKFGVSFRVQTLGGYHILGNLQAAGGVHGQLTVVAKVQHTLICVKIPLEVDAALRGSGCVVFLIAQLAINGGGQAAFFGARLDVAVAISFWNGVIIDFLLSCNANGHPTGLPNRISMRRRLQLQIVQLVVVGLVR